jgi:hypothetical protein
VRGQRSVTLRIKRKYFDLIASGEKKIEYRETKQFYVRLFSGRERIVRLKLHYQSPRQLTVSVKKIVQNRSLFEIHLGNDVKLTK